MKRIIIAFSLLLITVLLTVLSENAVNKYCDDVKNGLYNASRYIKAKDYNNAAKCVENVQNDKISVPFIYNLDFKKIKKELDDAKNLLDLKQYDYAEICIFRSISFADDIKEEYSFFSGGGVHIF